MLICFDVVLRMFDVRKLPRIFFFFFKLLFCFEGLECLHIDHCFFSDV
ncbi:hypothetical protein LOK49_LG07G01281 [Camellia lanceoleosa]|uniref:Uncharacterized protein n=1 Tax=Camellia lanceoleosa TaxID=1840588 RepID=A0ACC0H9E5_9ERIC|nr:hypothetical protein LOK49_LG07G01281 [Camellia lanceoleosa]